MTHGYYWGMGWGMWLIPIIVIVLLVLFLRNNNTRQPHNETPLDILKKRYAKGEITKEQFDEMKRNI
ncbi:MAG: SHOCT domain-containing protein [Lutibacter sp.]|uniref:SHOCT domain-containing protein n=1 Tax=Lutibacter sp. TaxID=1925666 RepID=UPI00299EF09B|nr:SHOCT domain-containing protein [Lutibacter sp.]MDX1828867.1 SHOCT domain-containing protein [Lutibacter sp.]